MAAHWPSTSLESRVAGADLRARQALIRPADVGNQRGMIGESGLPPLVGVGDRPHTDLRGHDQVIQPVPAAPPWPLPAQLAQRQALLGSNGVAEAAGLKALDKSQLGLIPALAAILPQPPVPVSGEGPHPPVLVLPARRVQVAAHD